MDDRQPMGVRPDPSRRDFLRVGSLSVSAMALSGLLKGRAVAQDKQPKARSVIQLWMWGGPPHLDTFDPKPDAGEDYSGPLRRPASTNVAGIRISELLPLMAQQADKYALLRGMTHPSGGHETAAYIVQTGTLPAADLVYPSIGAVISLKKGFEAGYKGTLPPYVSIPSSLGRFDESGFLGADYRAFATGGDPNSRDFTVQGLQQPRSVSDERLADRRELLKLVDNLDRRTEVDPANATLDSYQQKAYAMITSGAKKAFDLSTEKEELRNRYGRNSFGQSCLLARRMVENGVPFVTVNMGGWDTHSRNFEAMRRMLPVLDGGFATLLADLAERGLLESTIVVWYGEFGRTPKVAIEPPWEGGRHHFPNAFSAVVAGGGFKGGNVVGVTDRTGDRVASRPIYPWDLSASIYKLMGVDPWGKLPHPRGCVAYVSPLATGEVATGGMLAEIM
jgi:uncharacterized protein (DUF1501 family)